MKNFAFAFAVFFNICFLLGAGLTAIALASLFDKHQAMENQTSVIYSLVISLVSVAILATGFYGLVNKRASLIRVYTAFLIVTAISAVCYLGYLYLRALEPAFADQTWAQTYAHFPKIIASLEQSLKCCGYDDTIDLAVPANCASLTGYATPCAAPFRHLILVSVYGTMFYIAIGLVFKLLAIQATHKVWKQISQPDAPLIDPQIQQKALDKERQIEAA